MVHTIYIEEDLQNHPRVLRIRERFKQARVIFCERYSEVFNPKAQNFRLQKQNPALILARKYRRFALPAPSGYGIGAAHNYYFSHMLNCLYDCRYCFLQGMYQSAHYVLFVNFEDFQQDIQQICANHAGEMVHFFSGYDCDSLAMEPVTGFAEHFLPFFQTLPNAGWELRTKSTQVRSLLNQTPDPHCIVAFSLSPDYVVERVEAKTPALTQRLEAMLKLQRQGWNLGLRFDPVIYFQDYQTHYRQLFEQVFSRLNAEQIHSVSLGTFRLPESYFKKIHKLYPQEKLLAGPFEPLNGMMGYQTELEQEIRAFCQAELMTFISPSQFFPCQ